VDQGQATVEYLGLVLVGLVVACLLVRAATPVEQLAMAMVHAIVPARHRAHPAKPPVRHRRRRHSVKKPCNCLFRSTWPETSRLTQEPPSRISAIWWPPE
jgi:hypothetical protein